MGIDIADVGRGEPGVVEGVLHAGHGADAVGMGRGDVVTVGVVGGAADHADDVCTPRLGVGFRLQQQRAAAFAHDEAVAV